MTTNNHDSDHRAINDKIERAQNIGEDAKLINKEILSSDIEEVNTSNCNNKRKRNSINRSQNDYKAANFPISSMQIGSWKREARHDEELIAKCYFKKKKMAWEILIGKLKAKFEISFYDIDAITSIFIQNKGILYIRLKKPPNFFCEENPQPKKHTSWQECKDFTDEQVATKTRVHQLEFSRGVLEKHYSKIINSDSELLKVSTKQFPMDESHFFYHVNGTMSEFPSNSRVPQQLLPFQGHENRGIPRDISSVRQFPNQHHNQFAFDQGGSRAAYVDSLNHRQFGNSATNSDHERLQHDYSTTTYHPQLLTTATPGILNNSDRIPSSASSHAGVDISQFTTSLSPALLNNANVHVPFSAYAQYGRLNGFSGAPNVYVRRLPPYTQMQQPLHFGNDNRFGNQSAMNNNAANQVQGLYMK